MTLKEYVIAELNKMLKEQGIDELIAEPPPRPRLAASQGQIVPLHRREADGAAARE